MRQYCIDRVTVSWQGLDLKAGLAAGSTIAESRNATSWTQRTSAMGELIRDYNPDKSGTVTLLVMQTSKLHQQLTSLANVDAVKWNIVGPMIVTDASSGVEITYKNAYIMTEPDEVRREASGDFPWVFGFERITRTEDTEEAEMTQSS